jgi:hypothetical protein
VSSEQFVFGLKRRARRINSEPVQLLTAHS